MPVLGAYVVLCCRAVLGACGCAAQKRGELEERVKWEDRAKLEERERERAIYFLRCFYNEVVRGIC